MAHDEIQQVLDDLLDARSEVRAPELALAAGISRQSAQARLRHEVTAGRMRVEGAARSTRYVRTVPRFHHALAGLEEHTVWNELRSRIPRLGALAGDDRATAAYTFSEMLNNAIDHSGGTGVTVEVGITGNAVRFTLVDDGIGAFEHVRATFGLPGPLDALQEVSKGKTTTDPSRHSGEGIFFTSKVASRFTLHSGRLLWKVDNRIGDQAVFDVPERAGTEVVVELDLPVLRSPAAVFAEYTTDFAFTRTRTVVKLFEVGVDFVSRSEARRLLTGLERFTEVVVDFQGVAGVGQAFADEIFRVWHAAHPEVTLLTDNANAAVLFMVRRAQV